MKRLFFKLTKFNVEVSFKCFHISANKTCILLLVHMRIFRNINMCFYEILTIPLIKFTSLSDVYIINKCFHNEISETDK